MAKKNRDPETSPTESAPASAAAATATIEPPQYGDDSAKSELANSPAKPPAKDSPIPAEAIQQVMIEVPIARSNSSRYASQGLRPLSFLHARILRDIADALIAEETKRENGTPVRNPEDALAWLLERVNSARNSNR